MNPSTPLVITISRQLGSGGAYIGQKLAKELNIYYADSDIITKAAEQLSVPENMIDAWDEKAQSLWESIIPINLYAPETYLPLQNYFRPTSIELFKTESEIIKRSAHEHSSVIIGRCGFHILRDHPNHISIFIHGDKDSRCKRIQETYKVDEKNALEMIDQNDKQRATYIDSYTDKKWTDACLYDLSINTSKMELDKCVDLILNYVK